MSKDLAGLLEDRVEKLGDSPLYSFLDREGRILQSLTFRSLYDESVAIARGLQFDAIGGHPVGLVFPHGPDFITTFFGCILAGCYPSPFAKPPGKGLASLGTIIRKSGIQIIVTSDEFNDVLEREYHGDRLADIKPLLSLKRQGNIQRYSRPAVAPDDIAFIQFSSGSTSAPKGVCIRHSNVMSNIELINRCFCLSADDTVLSWLPFTHDMGLVGNIIQSLFTGSHCLFISPYLFIANPALWISAISDYRVSVSGGPSFGYDLCETKSDIRLMDENTDLSCWRLAYCGSEPVRPRILGRFARKFSRFAFDAKRFYPCYGLAESTLFVCGAMGIHLDYNRQNAKSNVCVGRPKEEFDVVIIDPSTYFPVIEGGIGEILIASCSVTSGYYKNAFATDSAFLRVGHRRMLRTGDLGYLRGGRLYIVGRLDNAFKFRGMTFFLEDIEEIVCRAAEPYGIKRIAASSREADESGCEIILVVEVTRGRNEVLEGQGLVEMKKKLINSVQTHVGLIGIDILFIKHNSLPLTTSGKIRREGVAELVDMLPVEESQ